MKEFTWFVLVFCIKIKVNARKLQIIWDAREKKVGMANMASQLKNECGCMKNCWGVCEQNSIINCFHVDSIGG